MSGRGMDKVVGTVEEAVADVGNGVTILVGGFGGAGFPFALRDALIRRRLLDLTIIGNNADFGGFVYEGGLKRIVCTYPVGDTARPVVDAIEAGRVQLVLTPQGTLAEQIRAGGAGLGGVLTPTGVGTVFEDGYASVELDGRRYLLAPAIRGDVAIVRAHVADRYGNLFFRHASRNFNPLVAMAATLTIAEVTRIVEPGEIDPHHVHVPSVFVDRVVATG